MLEKSRGKLNLENRVDEAIEEKVIPYAIEFHTYGQLRTSNELRKEGVIISASRVPSVWMRNGLGNKKQRLAVLQNEWQKKD